VLINFRRKRLGAVRPSQTRPALSENSTNKRKIFKKRLSRYLWNNYEGFQPSEQLETRKGHGYHETPTDNATIFFDGVINFIPH